MNNFIKAIKKIILKNEAMSKSKKIDERVYREIKSPPGGDAFICQARSKLAEKYHKLHGLEYKPKTVVRLKDRQSHRMGDVYYNGELLRESMGLGKDEVVSLEEYVKRGSKKEAGGYL